MKSHVKLNHVHVIAGYKTFSNMSDYNTEGLWSQSLSAFEWESLSVGALPLPPDPEPTTGSRFPVSHHVVFLMPTQS